MSEENSTANVATEVVPPNTTHTAEELKKQASDPELEESVVLPPCDGGDAITLTDEKLPDPQKVLMADPNSVLLHKDDVTEKDVNSEEHKSQSNEAVAKSPASDVLNSASESVSSDAAIINPLLEEILERAVEANETTVNQVSEVVINNSGDDSSSDDETGEKEPKNIDSGKAQASSVDNGSKPKETGQDKTEEKETSLNEETEAGGSEATSKSQQKQGRRKGYRNRTKSGGQNGAAPRSDTESATEPGSQQNGSRVRRNSFRRPYRGGRGRGRRRGRGHGGFNDGGLSSPPFRQNFNEPWNSYYGGSFDNRFRQSDYNYRPSSGNRDRPGYYAARVVRGTQNKPKQRNEDSASAAQGNATESGAVEAGVINMQSNDGNRRPKRGNHRNRSRSGRFVNDPYSNNEAVEVADGVPLEQKTRQNYYRYSYRAPTYPRQDYHGQMQNFYHGYYYDGGYNRPYYYTFGNGYGYGRGSRGYNGGNRRGGYRPRNKSNANQSEPTTKNEVTDALTGVAITANGTADTLTAECSS